MAEVRAAIKKLNAESHIVSALDDIACKKTISEKVWSKMFSYSAMNFIGLLNLRGSDIEYNPVFFAYVIITNDELHIYLLNEQRFTDKIYNHFYTEDVDVILKEYNNTLAGINNVVNNWRKCVNGQELTSFLSHCVLKIRSTTGKVLLSSASEAIQSIVPNERRVIEQSPIVLMKVIKNEVEALGMRQAVLYNSKQDEKHIWPKHFYKKNIVMVLAYSRWSSSCQIFALAWNWNRRSQYNGNQRRWKVEIFPKVWADFTYLFSIYLSLILMHWRSQQENYRGLSFPTISAVGKWKYETINYCNRRSNSIYFSRISCGYATLCRHCRKW